MDIPQTSLTKELSQIFGERAINNITDYVMEFSSRILMALLVYFVGKFIIEKVLKLVRAMMNKRQIEPSLRSFTDSALSIGLYFVLGFSIVTILGIQTTEFAALFAAVGMAIGMAMSGTLQNFAGGVMILLFKPYKVGDVIDAQGFCGKVEQIQIFHTIIMTADKQTIIIPNGGLATGSLKNLTKSPHRRVDINVEVAYGTKPEDVRVILRKIIDEDERIIKESGLEPALPMAAMSASSIVFSFRVWVESANYWPVLFDCTERIYTDLTAAGIEIPFQQIDVHVKN
ncbi:MAG: mechanosensitive ion channel [Bacteroidaceae bacterium]|nr:mechanosensitive ion channel [Bacteroidaceae bacterium]